MINTNSEQWCGGGYFKGKCPHRSQPLVEGGPRWANPRPQGLYGRTSSLGVQAGVLGGGRSSVRFRGQENS